MEALRARGLQDESYAYLACMAVARSERRRGAASALLAAAERLAGKWAQNWVLLHVHCDNFPAQRVYHQNRRAPVCCYQKRAPVCTVWWQRLVCCTPYSTIFLCSGCIAAIRPAPRDVYHM